VLSRLGCDRAIGSAVPTWAERQDQSSGILSLFCANLYSNREKSKVASEEQKEKVGF